MEDGPLQDKGMNDMEKAKLNLGEFNKAWIATLVTFGSQWGFSFDEAATQLILTLPEDLMQSGVLAAVCGVAVWYLKNKDKKDDK